MLTLVALLVAAIAWPLGLLAMASGRLNHVEALSGAPATPGTTFLLMGSDARGSGGIYDETTGSRPDTIMVLHQPDSGPTALISIPRDSFVPIPGRNSNRINASYVFGGAPLLVATVEHLTGLTIDHFVEIGFGGVGDIVDALGTVNLCLDFDVHDVMSGLFWTAGCHDVDGTTAIAFTRMRYGDPRGDIGRAERQRQLINVLAQNVVTPGTLVNPVRQLQLLNAGIDSLRVSEGTGVFDLATLALAFRAATGEDGITGTPWIASVNHRVQGVGSTVLLDATRNAELWSGIRDGSLPPGVVGGI